MIELGKHRVLAAISIIAILAGAILFVPARRVLQIQNRKNHKQTYYFNAKGMEYFDISYTHSVNKGRVHDYYDTSRKDNNLLLDHTKFVSYGAGIPEPEETPGAYFEVTNDGYIIHNLNRLVQKLTMAVGIIANHKISFYYQNTDNKEYVDEYTLTNLFPAQNSITLEIKRVSLISYILHNYKNGGSNGRTE